MTWSIVARDPATGAFGVAVTTKFFAVGAVCPAARGSAGALATQALVNPTYRARGLALLEAGESAAAALAALVAADPGRRARQAHLIDRAGRPAAHTGDECVPWCGHLVDDGFSVAGNMLAGPAVIADTAAAYRAAAAAPFAERLIAALDAGQAAGGDKRGKQSAALIVHAGADHAELDLRVDDHPEPLAELRRLYLVSLEHWALFRRFLPTRDNPGGIWDRAEIERALAELPPRDD